MKNPLKFWLHLENKFLIYKERNPSANLCDEGTDNML